ncbi:hypothetical protein VN12_14085 [Pirellula sp. SH-Sr6A]|nr:hypothetical protein VN12_14085 [Pirellula sp. SH-Sr6A]
MFEWLGIRISDATQIEKNLHGASQQWLKTLSKCFDFGDKA